MKFFLLKAVLIVFLMLLIGCDIQPNNSSSSPENVDSNEDSKRKTELFISAAASLTDAMVELEKAFQEKNPNIDIIVNLGSSGKLAQQIQSGAPVDIFLSANQMWMDILEEEDLIIPDSKANFTGNKIALITKKDMDVAISSFNDLDSETLGKLSIGNPDSVPAGKYTKEALVTIEKWDELEEQFVLAKDVRHVLTYVESGNVDIGFVYSSDALISDKVEVAAEADSNWHTPIIYPAAITSNSENVESGKAFLEFLQSKQAQSILNKFGFTK